MHFDQPIFLIFLIFCSIQCHSWAQSVFRCREGLGGATKGVSIKYKRLREGHLDHVDGTIPSRVEFCFHKLLKATSSSAVTVGRTSSPDKRLVSFPWPLYVWLTRLGGLGIMRNDLHTLDSHTWAFPRGDTPRSGCLSRQRNCFCWTLHMLTCVPGRLRDRFSALFRGRFPRNL